MSKMTLLQEKTKLKTNEKVDANKLYKIWIVATLLLMSIVFIMFIALTAYIDPLFHYHKPLEGYEYPINDERYQNDGIVRMFQYDGIITGTSMTENFMKSEADEIFQANFIKVPFFGAYYKEINENLKRAYQSDNAIKYVIRCLDYSVLVQDKNAYRQNIDYPTYLYNDNIFDDLSYVLNKSILLNKTREVIRYTRDGQKTTSFDVYANWNASYEFGEAAVLSTYKLNTQAESIRVLTEEERIMILENIRQNVTDLADEHPETVFYLFFPPYSICYWDALQNAKEIDWHIDAEKIAIEEILRHPNIKLYSFCDDFELVCGLDNYKDYVHYGEWVNSQILRWMWDEEHLLTQDNYLGYIEAIRDFYSNYDYGWIHERDKEEG